MTVHDSTLEVLFDGGLRDAVGAAEPAAGISPEWTRRYTVILETRITSATSATVKNLAFEKFDSADITHIPLLSATTPVFLRCADAEPSNNRVLVTLDAHVAIVKARRFRDDAANCSRTDAVTSHSMQASVTLCP